MPYQAVGDLREIALGLQDYTIPSYFLFLSVAFNPMLMFR